MEVNIGSVIEIPDLNKITYKSWTPPVKTPMLITYYSKTPNRIIIYGRTFTNGMMQRVNLTLKPDTEFVEAKLPNGAFPLDPTFKFIPITVGSDPECFVGDEKGKVIPAWRVFPNHKEEKWNTPYWDGVQAEFKVPQDSCLAFLVDDFQRGLQAVRKAGTVILDSVVEVPKAILNKASKAHIELGCNPSMNAYGKQGMVVLNGRELPFRFAGMHMHFGVSFLANNTTACINTTKALDSMLGLVLTAIGGEEENPIRRMYYGLPGEFRMPKHGLEYRVPASWVMKHPALVHLAFDLARFAINLQILNQFEYNWDADEDEVCGIITNSDSAAALKVLERNKNKATLAQFLLGAYGPVPAKEETFWNILTKKIVFEKKRFDHYWGLDGDRFWVGHSEGPTCNMVNLLKAKGVLA